MDMLGYAVAILIITVIVGIGVALIQTDGQLAVTMTAMFVLMLGMGLMCIYMRSQRYTKHEMMRKVGGGSYFFEYISPMEQKLLQGSIVLAISMIILGVIEKGPKVLMLIKEYFNG